MTDGVHLGHWARLGCVSPVVGIEASGHTWAGRRFDKDRPQVGLGPMQLVLQKRIDEAGRVAATTRTANEDVRIVTGHLHLLDGFQPNDRLVQQDKVHHAAQRVLVALVGHCVLQGLADGNAQAARRIGVRFQDGAPGVGLCAGAGHHGPPPGLHGDAAIGLLVIADGDHEDLALQAEQLRGKA